MMVTEKIFYFGNIKGSAASAAVAAKRLSSTMQLKRIYSVAVILVSSQFI